MERKELIALVAGSIAGGLARASPSDVEAQNRQEAFAERCVRAALKIVDKADLADMQNPPPVG